MAFNRYLGGFSRGSMPPNPYQPNPLGNPRSAMIGAGVVNRGNQNMRNIYLGGYGRPGGNFRPPPAPPGGIPGPVPRPDDPFSRPPPAPPGGVPGPVPPPIVSRNGNYGGGFGTIPGGSPGPVPPAMTYRDNLNGGGYGTIPGGTPGPTTGPGTSPVNNWNPYDPRKFGGRAGSLNLGGYGRGSGVFR